MPNRNINRLTEIQVAEIRAGDTHPFPPPRVPTKIVPAAVRDDAQQTSKDRGRDLALSSSVVRAVRLDCFVYHHTRSRRSGVQEECIM